MLKLFPAVSAGILLSVTSIAMAANVPADAKAEVLFSYSGKDYQLKDLQPNLQQKYFDNLQKAQEQNINLLDQAVLDVYIDRLAASKDRSFAETQAELLKIEPVNDEDVKAIYEQYKSRIGMPFEQAKEMLRGRIGEMRQADIVRDLIAKAKAGNGFELKITELVAPRFVMDLSAFPVIGDENAPVTIVKVADYRCGYCKKAQKPVKEMLKKYAGKIKLVYIDFPVVQKESGISQAVMAGAYCARQQGKFWEYNSAAYDMQKDLRKQSPSKLSKMLKLDENKFQVCTSSKESTAFVDMSAAYAEQYGVTGTPTFFINGRRLHTHDPEKGLEQLVKEALGES